MKKHYIAPAANTHKLVVESPMLTGTNNTLQDFGNGEGEYKDGIGSDEGDDITGI